MKPRYRVIDLFSGCGGLTQGFVQSGDFQPVSAVEHDPDAAASYAANFGEHVFVGEIADWVNGPIPRADVVIGGPPCQGFSALGKGDPDDPRNELWDEYVETIRRVRPAFFVLENVPQFLRSIQFEALRRETRARGRLSGWRLEPFVLNASDYGVAQSRRRAVVIGRPSTLPELGRPPVQPSRRDLGAVLAKVDSHVTATDFPSSEIVINGRSVAGAYKTRELHVTRRPTALSERRYRAIPAGGSRKDLPDELLTDCWRKHNSGSGDVMGRLSFSKASVTVRTEFFKPEKGRYLHPVEHRPITHYEAALIQGFPEEFLWCGSKGSIARQIGNAVPPPLAQAIAEHVSRSIA